MTRERLTEEAIETDLSREATLESRALTILLVDDEELTRVWCSRTLRASGHEVLDVANLSDAFMVCRHHSGEIHLMVTDIVMPVMNGVELANRMLKLRPDMQVLYMSAYTDHITGPLPPGAAFLRKPFAGDDLIRKVRGMFDADA